MAWKSCFTIRQARNFKGRSHIRYAGTINAGGILPIREYNPGQLPLVFGDVFVIREEYRLHDKLVAATAFYGEFPPDYLVYSDEGSNPSPIAHSGGAYAALVDDGQSYATVQMTGSTSYTVDPDSGGSVTHLWTLPTGVAFAPGSSSTNANPVLRVDVGEYVVNHAVTDSSNSKTTTQHVAIRIHDAADPPLEIILRRREGTEAAGWAWEVELPNGADLETLPDGCLCILWARDRMNGAWQAFRNLTPGRAPILGVGYADRDTSSGTGVQHQLKLEVISPLAKLRQIVSYSKVMTQSAAPDAWSKIKTLGVKRAVVQLLYYYSSLVESGFDLHFDADFIDFLYPELFIQRSTFYDQVLELATAVDARFVCDASGRFELHTAPPFIPLADRAAVTTVITITEDMWLDYEFVRKHNDEINQYKVSGISGGLTSNAAYYALYPGATPGEGINLPIRERLILDSTAPQTDVNERAGRYGALDDLVFVDANNERRRAFEMRLTLWGALDVFDFRKEWVELVITDNLRGISMTAFRFWVKAVAVAYESGGATITLTLTTETHANAGESYFPPTDPQLPPIEVPSPPPITAPPNPIPAWTGALPGKFVAIDAAGAKVARASSYTLGTSFDWEEVSTGLSGNGIWITADPFNYFRYFALTDVGLYVCNDLWATSPTFSLVASNATLFGDAARVGHRILMSHNKPGWIAVLCGRSGITVNFNRGAGSWAQTAIDGGTPAWGTAVDIANMSSAAIFGWNSTAVGNIVAWRLEGGTAKWCASTDYGLTWTVLATFSSNPNVHMDLQVPYKKVGGVPNNDWTNTVWYFIFTV